MKLWSDLSAFQQEELIKLSYLGQVFSLTCFKELVLTESRLQEVLASGWVSVRAEHLEFSSHAAYAQASEKAKEAGTFDALSFWRLVDSLMAIKTSKDLNFLDLQGVHLAFNELYKLKGELEVALDFTPERVLWSVEIPWLLGRSRLGESFSKSLFETALKRLGEPSTPKETWLHGWLLWDLGRATIISQDPLLLDVEEEGNRSLGSAMIQVGMEEVLSISDAAPEELRATKDLLQKSGLEFDAQKIFEEVFELTSQESVGGVLSEFFLERGQPVQALSILDVCTPDDFDALKVDAYTQLGDLRLAGDYAINAARKAAPQEGAFWAIRASELYRNADALTDALHALEVLEVDTFSPTLRLLYSAEEMRVSLLGAKELSSSNQLFSQTLETEVEQLEDVDAETLLQVARAEYLNNTSKEKEALALLLKASLKGLKAWSETFELAFEQRNWEAIKVIATKGSQDEEAYEAANNLLHAQAADAAALIEDLERRPEFLRNSVSILLENNKPQEALDLCRQFKTGLPAMLIELLLAKGFKKEARRELVIFLSSSPPTPLRAQAAGILLMAAFESTFTEEEAKALGRALSASIELKGSEHFWEEGLTRLKAGPFAEGYQSLLKLFKNSENTRATALKVEGS